MKCSHSLKETLSSTEICAVHAQRIHVWFTPSNQHHRSRRLLCHPPPPLLPTPWSAAITLWTLDCCFQLTHVFFNIDQAAIIWDLLLKLAEYWFSCYVDGLSVERQISRKAENVAIINIKYA